MAEDVDTDWRFKAGGYLTAPNFRNMDGWFSTDRTWEIVDSLTIRCAGDATAYLTKYIPMSINDGTAVRYFYGGSVSYNSGTGYTTVTVIPHDDGASAGNVLSTGGATSAFRYSKMHQPVAFPDRFSFTCTWTNVTTGTLSAQRCKYSLRGRTVFVEYDITLSGAAFTGTVSGTLPVPADADYANAALDPVRGRTFFRDASASATFLGTVQILTSTTWRPTPDTVSGSLMTYGLTSASFPMTWATGDILAATADYEAAA